MNLSSAQIQQLEEGGASLFYSEAIKHNAARKVALALNGDPASVIRIVAHEDGQGALAHQGVQVLDELVQLSELQAKSEKNKSSSAHRIIHPLVWLGALSAVSVGAAWLYQQPELIKPWVSMDWVPMHWFESKPPVLPAPEPQAPAPDTVADASDAQPSSVASQSEASAPIALAPADTASPSSPASTAVVAVASPDALCQSTEPGTLLTSKIPSKAGDMVYIVPLKAGSVCAKDGAGKNTVLTLQAKEGRSVYGPPPWRLYFEHMDQAQVYFQGERLRWPEVPTRSIVLREVKPQ
ncbi:hypothetical protein [Limnohabitans sp. T6-5]|uniref:hypothetical protein n=1 Tax=Limnohabitans sp. T6-5 TaxID=1100724 RepID=UPI001E3CFE9F|nr:hypothetical protein [Limnohabitans sp. T6-5]